MITIKSDAQIALMQRGGDILRRVLDEVVEQVRPGVTTAELDALADSLIVKYGGAPGFKRVKGYKHATCMCVNEQLVHTPPSKRVLLEGDVLTIDAGVYYGGLHTDSAETVLVGQQNDPVKLKFLETGKKAVSEAIKMAVVGNYIGHISQKLEEILTSGGYYVVRELTGHGVGKELHEDPMIPGFLDRAIERTPRIKAGMTLAVEVIYAMGTDKMVNDRPDNWSIKTRDNSIGACFEDSIAVLNKSTLILT